MNIRKDKYIPVAQLNQYNKQMREKIEQQKLSQATMTPEQQVQIENYEKIQNDNEQMVKFITTIQNYEESLKKKDAKITSLYAQLKENEAQILNLQDLLTKTQNELDQKNQYIQDKENKIDTLQNEVQQYQQLQTKYDKVKEELAIAEKHLLELENTANLIADNQNKELKDQQTFKNVSSVDQFIEESNDDELEEQAQGNKTDVFHNKILNEQDRQISISINVIKQIQNNVKGVKTDLNKMLLRLKQDLNRVSTVTIETKFKSLIKLLQQERRKQSIHMNQLKNLSFQSQNKQLPNQQKADLRYMQPTVSKLLKTNPKIQQKVDIIPQQPELKQLMKEKIQPSVSKDIVGEDNKLLKQQIKALQKQIQTLSKQVEDKQVENHDLQTLNQKQQIQISQLIHDIQEKSKEGAQQSVLSEQNQMPQENQEANLHQKYQNEILKQLNKQNQNPFINIPEEIEKHFNIMYYQIFHVKQVNDFIIQQHNVIEQYAMVTEKLIQQSKYIDYTNNSVIFQFVNNIRDVQSKIPDLMIKYEYIKILIERLTKNDNAISQLSVKMEDSKAIFKNLTYNSLSKEINQKLHKQQSNLDNSVNQLIQNVINDMQNNLHNKLMEIQNKSSLVQQKMEVLEQQVIKYMKNSIRFMKQNYHDVAKINKEAIKSKQAYQKAVGAM